MQYSMLIFVGLIGLIPSILSLNCYVCNSNENTRCADDASLSDFALSCTETVDPYCRKIVQTIDKQTSIVRTCGSKIGSKSCYKTAGTNSANVCSCNENLCNNAINFNQQQRSMTIISSIIILAITMILLR